MPETTEEISTELILLAKKMRDLIPQINPGNEAAITTANAIADTLLLNAAACIGLGRMIEISDAQQQGNAL
jgi:hypothetical protein